MAPVALVEFGGASQDAIIGWGKVASVPLTTVDEAREAAIKLGALKPQGFFEFMSANLMGNTGGSRWEDTPLAQRRLKLWTEAILNGEDPRKVKI